MKDSEVKKLLHEHHVAIGRKGAAVRAVKTTPEQRKRIARNAAKARWKKRSVK